MKDCAKSVIILATLVAAGCTSEPTQPQRASAQSNSYHNPTNYLQNMGSNSNETNASERIGKRAWNEGLDAIEDELTREVRDTIRGYTR